MYWDNFVIYLNFVSKKKNCLELAENYIKKEKKLKNFGNLLVFELNSREFCNNSY